MPGFGELGAIAITSDRPTFPVLIRHRIYSDQRGSQDWFHRPSPNPLKRTRIHRGAITSNGAMVSAAHSSEQDRQTDDVRLVVDAMVLVPKSEAA